MEARIMMFVVQGERPNLTKTAETLATITGGRITVLDTRPYASDNKTGITNGAVPAVAAGKRLKEIHKMFQFYISKKRCKFQHKKKIFLRLLCEYSFRIGYKS